MSFFGRFFFHIAPIYTSQNNPIREINLKSKALYSSGVGAEELFADAQIKSAITTVAIV